jgi:hypothetical protein
MLMTMRPGAGRTDWKYPRHSTTPPPRAESNNLSEWTPPVCSERTSRFTVRKERPDVKRVHQCWLHADDDIESLQQDISIECVVSKNCR